MFRENMGEGDLWKTFFRKLHPTGYPVLQNTNPLNAKDYIAIENTSIFVTSASYLPSPYI